MDSAGRSLPIPVLDCLLQKKKTEENQPQESSRIKSRFTLCLQIA